MKQHLSPTVYWNFSTKMKELHNKINFFVIDVDTMADAVTVYLASKSEDEASILGENVPEPSQEF